MERYIWLCHHRGASESVRFPSNGNLLRFNFSMHKKIKYFLFEEVFDDITADLGELLNLYFCST